MYKLAQPKIGRSGVHRFWVPGMVRLRLGPGAPRLQLVIRWRPRLTVYIREEPVTVLRPTPAQAEARLRFAEAASLARVLGPEGVAKLIGGRVVEKHGRRWVQLPDGRVVPPQNALVWWFMRGWRSPQSRVWSLPRWVQELYRQYPPVPVEQVLKLLRSAPRVRHSERRG